MGQRWGVGRARSADAPGNRASTRGAAAGGSAFVPPPPPVAPGVAPRHRGGRHLHALDAALIAAVVIGLLLAAFLLVADPWLPPIHDL